MLSSLIGIAVVRMKLPNGQVSQAAPEMLVSSEASFGAAPVEWVLGFASGTPRHWNREARSLSRNDIVSAARSLSTDTL
jgi:hypothetical protein